MDGTVIEAQTWAESLLTRAHRGPGDTIDNAMGRVERKHGLPPRTLWKLRYRPPQEIVASVYLKLQAAYLAECERQAARLRHELELARKASGDALDPSLVAAVETALVAVDAQAVTP